MSERCTRYVGLRPNVYAATAADGQVALVHAARWGEQVGTLTVGEQEMLRELAATQHTEPELLAKFGAAQSTLLHRLHAGGWLTVHYGYLGRELITVRPLGPHRAPRPQEPPVAPRLSRFALLRRDANAMVLEAPLSRAAIHVHDAGVLTMIHHLATSDAPLPNVGLPRAIVTELLTELTWYGFVHEAEEDVRPDLATEQWSAHELWFHSRSRTGYHDLPFGGTLWGAAKYPPLPARREPWPGTAVPLPDPGPLPDASVAGVLEGRRSERVPDEANPLTLDQLSGFLHWTARVRRVAVDGRHEVSLRPSPSGGALHALEIYPVVTNVTGLPAGMYHYDPFAHVLEPVPANDFATRQLLARAVDASGGNPIPQALLVIAARFGRTMWKYQSMAYAIILKDLGALYQTMYLVATAMGLAPCAIGAGDIDLFAQATGLNPLTESSVGEFILSSRAP